MRTLINFDIRIFLLLLLVLDFTLIHCQNNKIDSLLQLIENQKEDTSRIKILLKVSREYSKTDPEKALEYDKKAYFLAQKSKFLPGIIDAIIETSNYYTIKGNFDSAEFYSLRAIKLSDSLNVNKWKAASSYMHANVLLRKGGPAAAKEFFFKANNTFKEIGDSTGFMNSLNGLGVVYYWQAEYDSAIYYYLEFLKMCKKMKNEEGSGKGLLNLGTAYNELMDFPNAEKYLLESIQVNEKYNNLRFLSMAYNNLGSIAFKGNDLEKALFYYKLSQEQNVKSGNVVGLAQVKNNIGNVYQNKKEYKLALSYYTEAKDLFTKMNNIDGIVAAFKNTGLINERLKNYSRALEIYDSCLILARKSKLFKRVEELLFNIHRTYELTGEFRKAYEIQTEWVALKDSIFNLEKDTQLKELEIKYQKEKDQSKILNLENTNLQKDLTIRKKTNQRNLFLIAAIGLLLITVLSVSFIRYRSRKEKIIADQKIKQLEEEKRLLAASSLVHGQEEERKRIAKDLHDGIGVILSTVRMQFSALKDKSIENKPLIEKATKLLEQAASDVRRISHNMMPGLLSKFGFFEAVEDLFEQINNSGKIKAEMHIEGEKIRLKENLEIMLYRIIQEMVNNSLKYAEAKNISLILGVLPEKLSIQFSDDGKGFDVEEKLNQKTAGLTNIMSRVNFLKGEISIESLPGKGTIIFLHVPINNE